jgi:hypothetical protein
MTTNEYNLIISSHSLSPARPPRASGWVFHLVVAILFGGLIALAVGSLLMEPMGPSAEQQVGTVLQPR